MKSNSLGTLRTNSVVPPLTRPVVNDKVIITTHVATTIKKQSVRLCIGAMCFFFVLVTAGFLVGRLWNSSQPDSGSGSYLYSAMRLYEDATGVRNDTDLEQVLHFVISDMGAKWTYREFTNQRFDTVLFYHPDRCPFNRLQYNTALNNALPSRFDGHKQQSWWAGSGQSDVSSCICGYNGVDIMQILYSEDSKMHRVGVVVHEYYHVLQIHYCRTVYDDRTHFVMWLSEGAATVLQNLYITYWLETHPDYQDYLFDPNHGFRRIQ